MSVVYDDASAHHAALAGDLPRKAAATHIGHFFAWAAARGLVSDVHARVHAEEFGKLQRRWFTGRDYVLIALDGRLTDEHLDSEGGAFAEAYYVQGTYLHDYEETLRKHHPSRYHVHDDWETHGQLEIVLDRSLAAFREARPQPVVGAAAAAAPPSPPAATGVLPRPPPPLPGVKVKQPPPLPKKRPVAAPRRGRRAGAKTRGGSGKWWLLAIVLVFLGVRACGALVESQRSQDARFDGFVERMQRENSQRRRRMREHAERMQRELHGRGRTESVRRADWGPTSPEQEDAAEDAGLPIRFENGLGMRFVLIPPGSFIMGSPVSEEGRSDEEEPHNVVIRQPFYMLTTEVSNTLFRRFRPDHHSRRPDGLPDFNRGPMPVTSVSYGDATAFCTWLEERDPARSYALPSEAQWEYACRAGGHERFWWGYDEEAAGEHANVADASARGRFPQAMRVDVESRPGWQWFDTNDGQAGPAFVGGFRANPWGLYDMLGNVAEWCADWHGLYLDDGLPDPVGPTLGTRRIVRGGGFETAVSETRCAHRNGLPPDGADPRVGFRVLSVPRN